LLPGELSMDNGDSNDFLSIRREYVWSAIDPTR
jgi:hypothetical protein